MYVHIYCARYRCGLFREQKKNDKCREYGVGTTLKIISYTSAYLPAKNDVVW